MPNSRQKEKENHLTTKKTLSQWLKKKLLLREWKMKRTTVEFRNRRCNSHRKRQTDKEQSTVDTGFGKDIITTETAKLGWPPSRCWSMLITMFCKTSKTGFYSKGLKNKEKMNYLSRKLKRLLILTTEKEFWIKRNSWAKTVMNLNSIPKSKTRKENSWTAFDHLITGTSLRMELQLLKLNTFWDTMPIPRRPTAMKEFKRSSRISGRLVEI